jgi:hypothetical protein
VVGYKFTDDREPSDLEIQTILEAAKEDVLARSKVAFAKHKEAQRQYVAKLKEQYPSLLSPKKSATPLSKNSSS